jgi:aspartoacylase
MIKLLGDGGFCMIKNVCVFGGTHGNEWNGAYLALNWKKKNFDNFNFRPRFEISNLQAFEENRRFIEKDLNRSFSQASLNKKKPSLEEKIASDIVNRFGPSGSEPCDFVLDLHTTTGKMGPTVILDNKDPLSFEAAKYIALKNPDVKIIHNYIKPGENHFLTSIAPHALIFELGPVPQGALRADIFLVMERMLCSLFEFIDLKNKNHEFDLENKKFPIYNVTGKLNFPVDAKGKLEGMVHEERQDTDFLPMEDGALLFYLFNGESLLYKGPKVWPIFINEAAYYHENIAMVLTEKSTF